MKTYRVTVNGVVYEVTVEETNAGAAHTGFTAPVSTPAPAPVASTPVGAQDGTLVKAPMPGNIIKVNVKKGDSVKKGEILCILEAMKMENEIVAPVDGVVASVEVAQGESVATDAVLISLH